MQKTYKNCFSKYFPYIHVLLLYCMAHQSVVFAQAPKYEYKCRAKIEMPTNYEEFGEFADIIKVVEDEIAVQEEIDEEIVQRGVFSKWTKSLKKWFLRRVKNVFKNV